MENSVNLSKVKIVALDFDGVVTNLDIDWHSAIRLASAIAGYDVKSLLTFFEASEGKPIFQTVSTEIEKLELEALKNVEVTPFITEFLQEVAARDSGGCGQGRAGHARGGAAGAPHGLTRYF